MSILGKYLGWILGLLVLLPNFSAIAQDEIASEMSTMTPYEAFASGRLLRAQFKNKEARAYLKYAADKGQGDAAYLYAIDISTYNANSRTPAETRDYLESAARLGNLNAMAYLAEKGKWLRPYLRQSWKKKYHDGLIMLAERSPAKALYGLAQYYKDSDARQSQYYLSKAISYNYPLAFMEQAKRYMGGIDMISTVGSRDSQVLNMYLKAANQDFLPAIKACIEIYEASDNYRKALFWRLKALELGDITSLAVVAKIYAAEAPSYAFVDKDLIKAYAYTELYLDNAGSDRLENIHHMMEQLFLEISNKMTIQEIEESKVVIDSYRSNVVFYNHDLYWDI